jgi:hypothetical protein
MEPYVKMLAINWIWFISVGLMADKVGVVAPEYSNFVSFLCFWGGLSIVASLSLLSYAMFTY